MILLSFPTSLVPRTEPFSESIPWIALTDLSEEHLHDQLTAITQRYGLIRAFIHLNPATVTARIATELLKQIFLIAKHLKPSLNVAAEQGRSWFVTVTHLDGLLGTGTTEIQPILGGFFGLTKTLNLEWEPVFCRGLDFSPELEIETKVQLLLAELYDPNHLLVEVGHTRQKRVTRIAEAKRSPDKVPTRLMVNHPIPSNAVFLVSGGGRGITAHCAIQLAKVAPCKFILLGRSEIFPEPMWAHSSHTEAALKKQAIATLIGRGEKPTPATIQALVKSILARREIVQTQAAIAQVGGQSEYLRVDLTNALELQTKLAPILQRWGAVTGIIHGAGVLADKRIEHKSILNFESVYATKIDGLTHLLDCVNLNLLQHLVLFSSAAGFYGNIGQSDYAIANEILNRIAYQFKRQYPNCHVISFNWGPWDAGMVTPALKQIFTERQISVIPLEAGTQRFVAELTTGDRTTVQVLIGSPFAINPVKLSPSLQTHRIRCKLTLKENPILQDHQIGGYVVLPIVFASAWLANTAEQLYPGYHFFSLENYQVLKGIVFDRTLADEYILDLSEVSKTTNETIELSALIWSKSLTGKLFYHYKGQMTLRQQIPLPPQYEGTIAQSDKSVADLSPYQDGTLFHGPCFQGIQRILSLTPRQLTMECKIPSINQCQVSQIPAIAFDPIAADIPFQCMLIWVRQFYRAGSLPLRCRKAEHFKNIPFDTSFYVSMEVESHRETQLIANITSYDLQGQVYSRILGAEVTISTQLNRLFAPYPDRSEFGHS